MIHRHRRRFYSNGSRMTCYGCEACIREGTPGMIDNDALLARLVQHRDEARHTAGRVSALTADVDDEVAGLLHVAQERMVAAAAALLEADRLVRSRVF